MSKFEHGLGTIIDPSADRPFAEIPTTRCVHCGGHFPAPSFGNTQEARRNRIGRGYCYHCDGYICGERCQECKPLERLLDELEGTVNPTAVSVSVPATLPVHLPKPIIVYPGGPLSS